MDIQSARELLTESSVEAVLNRFPYLANYFEAVRLEILDPGASVIDILNDHPEEYFIDYGLSKQAFAEALTETAERLLLDEAPDTEDIISITVGCGTDKDGNPENELLTLRRGEIVCVVGPTGAGKSRLLEDIECLAQGDTPTGRKVMINGEYPSEDERERWERHLVAELSQNMNFVMDLSVEAFLRMHAKSRGINEPDSVINAVVACANTLAGESFQKNTPVTQLSGGQSRALMIADTALLSCSPIILIDEIENAGIDRKKALQLLVRQEKIVLVSTHDPVLALMGSRRAVIENGGIRAILETSPEEKDNLEVLEAFDAFLLRQREGIRRGGRLDDDLRIKLGELLQNQEERHGSEYCGSH